MVGPAASGKSWLLDVFSEDQKPIRGSAKLEATVIRPNTGNYSRRATPSSVGKAVAKGNEASQLVDVLTNLRLWDFRDTPIHKLSPSQNLLVDLLPCFLSRAEIAIIDGHLDFIDPWILEDLLDLIDQHAQAGRAFLIATARPDIAEVLGSIIVLRSGIPRFAGTCQELIEQVSPAELTVELSDASTVQSMVEPLTVSIKSAPGRLELTSHRGQELAARLLTEGYGNVRSVLIRQPTLAQALKSIL